MENENVPIYLIQPSITDRHWSAGRGVGWVGFLLLYLISVSATQPSRLSLKQEMDNRSIDPVC